MKKTLAAVGAFALLMALPLASSAGTITSIFAGSSSISGGANDLVVGDTISFDVFLTLDAGVGYTALAFTATGDGVATLAAPTNAWAGVANQVTAWSFNTQFGTFVDTTGDPSSAGFLGHQPVGSVPSPALGGLVIGPGAVTGLGASMLIGTVTIAANTLGTFDGGAVLWNTAQLVDGFVLSSGGADTVTTITSSFTVIPEPGTALLMVLGLGGLATMGRKNRA